MRIAVFHNQPPGGARRALAGFCDALGRLHEVDVYALTSADDEWIPDARLGTPRPRVAWQASPPVRHGLWLDDLRQWSDLRALDAANRRAAAAIDAAGYDAVLVDACRASLVPSIVGHLRTPTVVYVHEGPWWVMGAGWRPTHSRYERLRDVVHTPSARVVRRHLDRSQRRAVRAAGLVLVNSQHTARQVRPLWGVEPVVCSPGVHVAAEGASRPRSGVLAVGEIEPRKGFDFLVDALATVSAGNRPVLRLLAHRATPATRAALLERADRAGVRVDLHVGVDDRTLGEAYASAALYLHGNHVEPLGLAAIEAMGHGCPVVAVAEGGVVESVVDGVTGRTIARDPVRFGAIVEELLGDAEARQQLGRSARDHVARSWAWPVRGPVLVEEVAAFAARAGSLRAGSHP